MSAEYQSRKAFKVHGRVQGVGFRWWAQRQARSLGLTGVVRNLPDGTVEISFAGADEAVREMCGRLERGPTAAFVRELEELPAPDQFPDSFQIGF